MPTVIKVYESHWGARKAVSELESAGIPSSKISMLATRKSADAIESSPAATGAGVGAVVGGGAGLLAGLGLLAIPGLGPIVAAGWLAPTAVGALTGGATGGIVAVLIDSGETEERAHVYAEALRRGGTLVSVKTEDLQTSTVTTILNRYNPMNPEQLREDYRKEGWESFDPKAAPYEISEAELERRRGLR